MRKALHEEVSKEITDKSVHIAVKMAKPVLDDFMKALSDAVKKPVKAAGHAIGQKIHPTEGKQSVKTLIRQGQGVSSIPLADEGLKDFQKIAKKYGVDFAVVKDKNSEPPIYTVFFKAKDQDAITRILDDYSAKADKEIICGKDQCYGETEKVQGDCGSNSKEGSGEEKGEVAMNTKKLKKSS